MTSPSNEDEEVISELIEDNFELTREEVEYFYNNIKHEYLSKDTYWFATNLLERMRKFLNGEQ